MILEFTFSCPTKPKLNMKTSIKLSAILLCLVLAGCIETSQQSLTENKSLANSLALDDSNPNARQGGGSGQIYLSVTVNDLKLASDGKGAYLNGIDGISAQFLSTDGSLSLTTSTTRIKNPRRLTFPDGAGYNINPNLSDNYLINVLANEYEVNPRKIQDIPVGEDQLMSMRVWGSNLKGTIQFRLLYDLGNGLGYETDKVLVKRTSTTTWTVESTNSKEFNGNATVNPEATTAMTSGFNGDLRGYYQVPFKMTLTKIN